VTAPPVHPRPERAVVGPEAARGAPDAAWRADAEATARARAFAGGRLRGTRRALAAAAGARAALWGAAAGAGVAAGARLANAPAGAWVAGAAFVAMGASLARAGAPGAWTLAGVALWVEARMPALGHALVTLADAPPARRDGGASGGHHADGRTDVLPAPVARALAERVAGARWGGVVVGAARRALGPPAGALAAALVLLALAGRRPADGAGGGRPTGIAPVPGRPGAPPVADPLARLRATVTPPAHARQPARTLDEPAGVTALVGSALVFDGTGDPARVRAAVVAPEPAAAVSVGEARRPGAPGRRPASVPLVVRPAAGGQWRVALAMPARPVVVRLAGPGATGSWCSSPCPTWRRASCSRCRRGTRCCARPRGWYRCARGSTTTWASRTARSST
jgi:hypothetical protein